MTTQQLRLDALVTPLGQGAPRLAQWTRKLKYDPANAKLALIGDSTSNGATGPAAYKYGRLAGIQYQSVQVFTPVHTSPGEGLAGMTADAAHFIDCGNSGMSLAVWLANYDANDTTAKSLRWLITQAPHLIVFSWGLNDVRLGQTTQAQLTALIVRAVTILRRALPGTDLVLQIPNSLSTTNQGGLNYVQASDGTVNPAGAAQAYTDLIRAAYYAVQDRWPNVVLADAQTAIFGTKAQPIGSGTYQGDQLHPGAAGQIALIDWLVQTFIGVYPAKVQTSAASVTAKALAQYAPWTSDPTVLDDPTLFTLLATCPFGSQGSGYMDVTLATAGLLTNYDIMRLPDGQVYQFPSSGITFSQNGGTTRILGSALPTNTATQGNVRFYRQAVSGDTALNTVLADPSWRYKRTGRVTAGSTTGLTIAAYSITAARATQPASEWATVMAAGDKVYVEGNAANPVTLAGGQFAASSTSLAITGLSGTDYSTYVGRLVTVVGTHADSVAGPQGVQGPAGGVAAVASSGRWSIPSVTGSVSSSTGAAGTDYAVPFVLLNSAQFTQLLAQVVTGNAGAAFRLGIRSSTNLLPDQLLIDAGSLDASTSGIKTATAFSAVSLTAGNLYWLTCLLTGTANANLTVIQGVSALITGRNVANESFASYSCGRSSTDAALPTAWGATYTPSGYAPLIRALAV